MEDQVPTGAGHAPEKQSQADDTALQKQLPLLLAGVDAAFPPYLWDLFLPKAELTVDLLRQATINPKNIHLGVLQWYV